MTRKEQIAADALGCMPFHPLAGLFPREEGRKFDELVGDLKNRPLNHPSQSTKARLLVGAPATALV
jgi:hypothetical protein